MPDCWPPPWRAGCATRSRPAPPRPRRYRRVIAVDGKTLRGARRPDGGQVHLLSALDTSTGIILAQVTVDAKSNEIRRSHRCWTPSKPSWAAWPGVLFVADALHTQAGHAGQIADGGAHLLVQVKGNQPTLHAQLKALPWPQVPPESTRDRGPGRRETRTVKAVTVATPGGLAFPSAAPAVRITRTRTTRAKTSRETAYLTVSLPPPTRSRPTCRTGPAITGTSKTVSITYGIPADRRQPLRLHRTHSACPGRPGVRGDRGRAAQHSRRVEIRHHGGHGATGERVCDARCSDHRGAGAGWRPVVRAAAVAGLGRLRVRLVAAVGRRRNGSGHWRGPPLRRDDRGLLPRRAPAVAG